MSINRYIQAVKDRGFMTSFMTGHKNEPWSKAKEETMTLKDSRRGYRLFALEGWRKYSRHCVYYQSLRYIAGVEKGQYWANRVPGNIDTVCDALEWLKPAAVKKAKGKVLRQGDIFIIEMKRDCVQSNVLPENHIWNEETRTLEHPEHSNLTVPFPAKFIPVKTMMGQGQYAD
jgi:hypothetical protein